MVLTTRLKALFATVAAVGVYILASSPDSPTTTVVADAIPRVKAQAPVSAGSVRHDTEYSLTRLARRVSEGMPWRRCSIPKAGT